MASATTPPNMALSHVLIWQVLYSGKCNNSVFDAVFEFEAELTLRAFITQVPFPNMARALS
eukprot:2922551-Prymnesium_polylepis.1